MTRPADTIFLRLAVKRGELTREQAECVVEELRRCEERGQPSKARHLCVQVNMLTPEQAREIKHEVRSYLERRASNESRPQRRIAGFEIESRLGCGAMGVVFKARHVGLNKTVALKLLNPEFATDPKYVARFHMEARSAARLDHPGIVQAYDVGQADDVHFIAMEFVKGKTVKELIDRRERVTETAAIEIVLQVLDALKHAHHHSIIHRDVKPANIMITRTGKAKLLDLGLARQTDVENGLTGEGRAIGTPYYMAPEQALDKGTDYRADLYSLGVTLFNMVTGRKPYEATTPVAVMNMHLKSPVPDVREYVPELSPGLSKILFRVMAKRPADRYQDHAALQSDLEAVLAGTMPKLEAGKPPEGVDYIKPRATQQSAVSSVVQRRRWVVAAVAAGVLTGAGLILFITGGQQTPRSNTVARGPAEGLGNPDLRERAARSMLQDLERVGSTGRTRVDALLEIARQYPDTEPGREAQDEARRQLAELEALDEDRFAAQTERLEGLAAQGKLLDARRGYEALAGSFEGAKLSEEARSRARQLEAQIVSSVADLETQALDMTRHGDLPGAARLLERTLALRSGEEHAEVLRRIANLDAQVSAELAQARERDRARSERFAAEEAGAVSQLPGRLRELIQAGELNAAKDLARELHASTQTPTLRHRVADHVVTLAAAAELQSLALSRLRQRVGQTVALQRRVGPALKGKLLSLSGTQLVVEASRGAQVGFRIADLTLTELVSQAKKGTGASDRKAFLLGVAALRIYQGSADAEESLRQAAAEGADTSHVLAVKSDLDALDRSGGTSIQAMHRSQQETSAQPAAASRAANPRPAAAPQTSGRAADELVARNLRRLFPQADARGFLAGVVELSYDFQGGQGFGPDDWKQTHGTSYPTPAGQPRVGLALDDGGRADFQAPLSGELGAKVRFSSQLLGPAARLVITLRSDGDRRWSCELGQLLQLSRDRIESQAGESAGPRVRAQRTHLLELDRVGHELISRFDGQEVARMPLPADTGALQLGLEWEQAALNLLAVEVRGQPAAEWVEAQLR